MFATLAAGTLCFLAILPGEQGRRRTNCIAAGLVLRLTGSWPTVQGLHLLPEGPSIVVANHSSYLDGILLTAVLPHNFRFVIKREVARIPLMNFYLKRTGAHFVERFDPHQGAADARKIMQTAEKGDSLAFFPEGTFLEEPGLRRFHKGAFKIAARKGLPLVPMTIVGTRHMLSADAWLPRPGSLKVVISEPLRTTSDMPLKDSMEHCRKWILNALDEPDLMAAERNPDSTG